MDSNDQTRVWNERVGDAWVRNAQEYDATLEPFGLAAMGLLDLHPSLRVLDVGCGTGQATVELAGRLHLGRVVGIDLSAPMLELARRRVHDSGLDNVEFRRADVQRDRLTSEPFDAAFSRFGVMFFDDPVDGFANIGRAVCDGGQLAFVAFQEPPANPFITVPVLTAAEHLSFAMPPAESPGPFSLADPNRIRSILARAGWGEITIEPGPSEAVLGGADDLESMARRVLQQNPATSEALAVAESESQEQAIASVAEALANNVRGSQVCLGAGTWLVHALRAPQAAP